MKITCPILPTPYPDPIATLTFDTKDLEYVLENKNGTGSIRTKSGVTFGVPNIDAKVAFPYINPDDVESLTVYIRRIFQNPGL